MTEIFKRISEYPNYGVSVLGNIKNLKTGCIRKPKMIKGRRYLHIWENGWQINVGMGKLALMTFKQCPNIPGVRYSCDHINRDKSDDRIENLRWATNSTQQINKEWRPNVSGEKHISLYGVRNIRYRFVIHRQSHNHESFYFDTLTEAVNYRDNYMREHNL